MTKTTPAWAALVATALVSSVQADEREELLKLKNTTVNLIDALVDQGILDKKKAQAIIKTAEDKAAVEAKQQRAEETAAEQQAAKEPPAGAAETGQAGKAKTGKSMHVTYVPEIVKDEIRNQVRNELREEVAKDVKAQAKTEMWGIPAALPGWINRFHPYIDNRLRFSEEFYDSNNAPYFNWLQINQDGGISQALAKNQAYLNTTIDRLRLRERFRFGFDADITDSIKAGFRLSTSNQYSPVSSNQTMGNYGESYLVAIDRAYLQYDFKDKTGNDWATLSGGRIPNPWMSTNLVYDPDLSFEGVAGTFRLNLDRDDPVVKSYRTPNPTGRFGINQGNQHPNSVFATAGVFPIQEINFSSADKWLFGGQLGTDWLVHNESRLKFAASYYYYKNISARRNSLDSNTYDWTAPEFMQKGNSLVAINDAQNQTACDTGVLGAKNVCLVGLASEFKILNITAMFDYADFAPVHVLLTADYAKNFGFSQSRLVKEFGVSPTDPRYTPKTNGYQVRMDVGNTDMRRLNDWSIYFAYRYLERDAVLDAFTDSVFHQGGTDSQGWLIGVQYGLATNTWLNVRWHSADSIDDQPLSIDTLNVDLNARF